MNRNFHNVGPVQVWIAHTHTHAARTSGQNKAIFIGLLFIFAGLVSWSSARSMQSSNMCSLYIFAFQSNWLDRDTFNKSVLFIANQPVDYEWRWRRGRGHVSIQSATEQHRRDDVIRRSVFRNGDWLRCSGSGNLPIARSVEASPYCPVQHSPAQR